MKGEKKAVEVFHMPKPLASFKRRMAVVLPKDAGAIIAYANIGKTSRVVEIGAGNGFLTYHLARVAKEVYAYEIRADAYKILSANIKKAKLDNVVIKNGDGRDFDEDSLDAIVVDIPAPEELVERAYERLNSGGYFVAYLPNIEQVKRLYEAMTILFNHVFVISLPLIEYRIKEGATRPKNMQLFHTAYLVFGQKSAQMGNGQKEGKEGLA